MSTLYPTLEDMKVDQLSQVQAAAMQQHQLASGHAITGPPAYPSNIEPIDFSAQIAVASSLYPSLDDYMGMQLQPYANQVVAQMPAAANTDVAIRPSGQVAPLTGNDIGLQRAEIKQGIRQVIVCKDKDGKIGLRVRHVNKGVFVAFVHVGSPAAMSGLRFGDQILQINGTTVAGWDTGKTHSFLKKADGARITMAIRDRPFERIITMHKDSTGHIGFTFKDGVINAIVKDSSAARNGVLIDHKLIELGGQNVLGLKDKEITAIAQNTPSPVTITIMPTFVYDHIVKCMGNSLIKNKMDHSLPDL